MIPIINIGDLSLKVHNTRGVRLTPIDPYSETRTRKTFLYQVYKCTNFLYYLHFNPGFHILFEYTVQTGNRTEKRERKGVLQLYFKNEISFTTVRNHLLKSISLSYRTALACLSKIKSPYVCRSIPRFSILFH